MTVDEYLANLPDDDRRALERVRKAIKQAAPEAQELISYRIPLYKLRGKDLIGFGAHSGHLSLYVMNSAIRETYAGELAEFDQAGTKTTIRFASAYPVPVDLVKKIVKTRVAEVEAAA